MLTGMTTVASLMSPLIMSLLLHGLFYISGKLVAALEATKPQATALKTSHFKYVVMAS